jgi:hypothetical protein
MRRTTIVSSIAAIALAFAPAAFASTPLNAIISVDDPAGNMGEARVRVVHASPDAPAVDILVNGSVAIPNVAFEEITPFASLAAGTYNVQVVPAGQSSPVVIGADLSLEGGTDYTVIATNYLSQITPIILTASGGGPQEGNVWVRFFHGSPDAPAVDIAVTGGDVLFPNVVFQQGTNYLEVPAGTYDLEARLAGTMDVALSLPGVALEAGTVYTVYATGLVADIGVLDDFYFIPAAARALGSKGSFFVTDVDINNSGQRPAHFKYLWLPRDTNNAVPSDSMEFALMPGEVIRHTDVLSAAFGVSDGTNAVGALALLSDSPDLLIFSRTYNTNCGDGVCSQAFPGIPARDMIMAGEKKRILAFTEDGDYRSNIGFLNGVGSPIVVEWARYSAEGTMIDSGSAELPAWGSLQLNQVFLDMAPVRGAYIDVWTMTEGGMFTAYGSVLDHVNSDPVTVMPQ